MIRRGTGEPVVLLHGVTGSETMWRNVIPLLEPHVDVIALTVAGHRGGSPVAPGAAVHDLVDDVRRSLDGLGLDRPHLVGNSLGGWIAIELARQGRAASVCALSPAGCWSVPHGEHLPGAAKLRRAVRITRWTRAVLPIAAHLSLIRRIAVRDVAAHGQRVTADELLEIADDLLGCTVRDELLTTEEYVAALDPLPCPVMLGWSERDRILPVDTIGARARLLLPGAVWRVLPDVGHVPMFDDPGLVADVICKWVVGATVRRQGDGRGESPGTKCQKATLGRADWSLRCAYPRFE